MNLYCILLKLFNLIILFFPLLVRAAPITITQVSDLNFGAAFLGDPVKVVDPGSTENAENASFLVTGDAGVTFNVTKPSNMWISHSSTSDSLRVRRFRGTPNRSGRIPASGQILIFLGATRNSIPNNISPGLYSGTFTMTVVY